MMTPEGDLLRFRRTLDHQQPPLAEDAKAEALRIKTIEILKELGWSAVPGFSPQRE